ncbi:MAG: prepilin-type N-terminal cleavage/methylation domain-containing protein [Desulfobulbaceae bacterium]|nr:prepilin-type N-terminal cleavage/methylation domain-containing protein [Desulfobulbaceae bacterium]
MTKKILYAENGFTIIETLIAITIFAIGILAVITMQTTSMGGNGHARQLTEETSWAADQMEQLMSLTYAALVDGPGTTAGLAGLNDGGITAATVADGGPIVSPDGAYSIYWNVAVDQPAPNLKTIRVIVTHNTANTPPVPIDFIKTNAI